MGADQERQELPLISTDDTDLKERQSLSLRSGETQQCYVSTVEIFGGRWVIVANSLCPQALETRWSV